MQAIRPAIRSAWRPAWRKIVTDTLSRYFSPLDPITQGHYTLQNPKTFAGDFEFEFDLHAPSLSNNTVLGTQATFIRFGSPSSLRFNYDVGGYPDVALSPAIQLNKLQRIKVSLIGLNVTVRNGDVIIGSGVVNSKTAFTVATLGMKENINYFNGIIANVKLTDLTNPANSESWALGNPTGVNTEQSSSGNNLLTYVNVTNRELFTKVGNVWEGVELNEYSQGASLLSSYLSSNGGIEITGDLMSRTRSTSSYLIMRKPYVYDFPVKVIASVDLIKGIGDYFNIRAQADYPKRIDARVDLNTGLTTIVGKSDVVASNLTCTFYAGKLTVTFNMYNFKEFYLSVSKAAIELDGNDSIIDATVRVTNVGLSIKRILEVA